MNKSLDWQIDWKCATILGILIGVFLLPGVQAASYWLDENGTSLTSGLVGYWKFSEGSGSTANDSSGYNNHGTLTSFDYSATSGWTDGKYGKALRFDGVNSSTESEKNE